jgi:hypothetical protein
MKLFSFRIYKILCNTTQMINQYNVLKNLINTIYSRLKACICQNKIIVIVYL